MSEVANKTREYLQERTDFLKGRCDSVSVVNGTLLWQIKSSITELEQTKNVLNGGVSVFEQIKPIDHAS